MDHDKDTIFARASGSGKAGVAVYRLSGPLAHSISKDLIGKRINYREAVFTALRDPADGSIIDRGVVVLFQKPKSFSGDDVAEYHLHGSRAVELSLFETLAAAGARPAEAGEFTLRAFRHGKMDLAQVEALADLIDAETTQQKRQALGQLDGRLSDAAEGLRARILAILTPLEADIDFPDEGDVPAAIAAKAAPAIAGLKDALTSLLTKSERARKIRTGMYIAVIGPPNAGKSSLVNALAGSEVAIVSGIAGTTRDVVEVRLDLAGLLATIADTAGLREATQNPIEAEGIARARSRAEAADIRIGVLDPRDEFVSRETLAILRPGDFLVWSHADLEPALPDAKIGNGVNVLQASGKTGDGIKKLVADLADAVGGRDESDAPALTRIRHVRAMEQALAALNRAEANLAVAAELAADDVRIAARALGGITGAVGVEDVLGEIFSSFCIGK